MFSSGVNLGGGGTVGGGGGGFWSLANGGALTGNNTISGAFNIGFTNNAFGFGVPPGSITANTTVDIRGQGTSSASSSLRVASYTNVPLFRIRDDGAILHGTNEQGIIFDETGTSIYRPVTNSFTRIANDGTVGSQMLFYGSTHATRPNRAELYTPLFHINNGVTGNVLIGGTTLTNTNTILDVQSTTQGVAFPRMTTTQRDAIPTPFAGLLVYNNSTNRYNYNDGTNWVSFLVQSSINISLDSTNFQIQSSLTKRRIETFYAVWVDGTSWTGNYINTNVLDNPPNNSVIVIRATFIALQTSGTPGSSGLHYVIERAFRRNATTTSAIAPTTTLVSSNDTGDTFTTLPTLSTSGNTINFERALTTTKTFLVSLKLEVSIIEQ